MVLPQTIGSDTRLIFGLHGFSDNARRFGYYTGLHNVAKDWIVVYPEATKPQSGDVKTGWNSGFCCGSGWVDKVDDVGFIKQLADEIISEYGLEENKFYVTGFSNGAFMSLALATQAPESVKAVAVSSGVMGTADNQLSPSQSVPVLLMHGQKDKTVPYIGGPNEADPEFDWLSFDESKSLWERANENQAPTETIVYENDGHQWHDWRIFKFWHKTPQASVEVINFFESLR